MKSLRDRILSAKTKNEVETLADEFKAYSEASNNTKTKVKKAVKERLFQLDEVNKPKKIKKVTQKSKKTKA